MIMLIGGFLLSMLRRCGFGEKLCNWIAHNISSMRISVLLNGSLTSFFNSYRGLRQGDPLSLLLFVIIMKALREIISAIVNGVSLSGFSTGPMNFFL
jgi:hypothetical protein